MSAIETNLLSGLAADLQTAGIGIWSTSTGYTAGQVGIVLDTVPQEPDDVIVLTDYPVTDDASLSDSVIGVQVRCRKGGQDPRQVKDLAASIFTLWQRPDPWKVGSGAAEVKIVRSLRASASPLGQDENGRYEYVQNFYMTVWRPSAYRE